MVDENLEIQTGMSLEKKVSSTKSMTKQNNSQTVLEYSLQFNQVVQQLRKVLVTILSYRANHRLGRGKQQSSYCMSTLRIALYKKSSYGDCYSNKISPFLIGVKCIMNSLGIQPHE